MTCWSGFFWSSFRCLGISVSHQQSPLALGGRRSGQDTPLKNHTNPPFAADASLVLASFGEFLLQREMMMRRGEQLWCSPFVVGEKKIGSFLCGEGGFSGFWWWHLPGSDLKNSAGFSSTFFDLEIPQQPALMKTPASWGWKVLWNGRTGNLVDAPIVQRGSAPISAWVQFLGKLWQMWKFGRDPQKDEPKSYLEPAPSFQNFLVLVQWA